MTEIGGDCSTYIQGFVQEAFGNGDWSSKEEARAASADLKVICFELMIEQVGVDRSRKSLLEEPRGKLLGVENEHLGIKA